MITTEIRTQYVLANSVTTLSKRKQRISGGICNYLSEKVTVLDGRGSSPGRFTACTDFRSQIPTRSTDHQISNLAFFIRWQRCFETTKTRGWGTPEYVLLSFRPCISHLSLYPILDTDIQKHGIRTTKWCIIYCGSIWQILCTRQLRTVAHVRRKDAKWSINISFNLLLWLA